MDECFRCGHKFEIGEKVSVAFGSPTNVVLCRKCADSFNVKVVKK